MIKGTRSKCMRPIGSFDDEFLTIFGHKDGLTPEVLGL